MYLSPFIAFVGLIAFPCFYLVLSIRKKLKVSWMIETEMCNSSKQDLF